MNSKEQTKKKITVRDVMTIAAMMVLTIVVSGVTGPLTLPFPFLYLYVCAGLQMFLCATFYLVVANRLNKHGIFLVWGVVYGVILGLSGYMFLLPYFVAVAAICELAIHLRCFCGAGGKRHPLCPACGRTALLWWESRCAGLSFLYDHEHGFSVQPAQFDESVYDVQPNHEWNEPDTGHYGPAPHHGGRIRYGKSARAQRFL